MARTLAIMFTVTTYGTWLRGDARGWIDDGRLMPPDPRREHMDRRRMKHEPFMFDQSHGSLLAIGGAMGEGLICRLDVMIYALAVQPWHAHFVIRTPRQEVAEVAKAAKEVVRWHVRANRPIWGDGYDKRFCFDEASVWNRIRYVERHNEEIGLPRRPWGFLAPYPRSSR